MFDRKACVYLVGRDYQIIFNTDCGGIAWVEVDGEVFPDAVNGIMRSETTVHRAIVPTEKLDRAGRYTVCFKSLPERKPYWPVTGETEKQDYCFYPANRPEGMRIYHLADAHSKVERAIRAGSYWGDKLDLLILNGDIPAESKSKQDILAVFDISGAITQGEHPVLFARGNHDMRGKYAIEFTDYIGTDEGRTYFTFRTGTLWGVVLDCGEDKVDSCDEYGGLVCSHPFREKQTEFLRDIIARHEKEYDAPGVKTRIAVCHMPFPTDLNATEAIFDIEKEIYADWTRELNKMGIEIMLSGHVHKRFVIPKGDSHLRYGADFPVFVSSEPRAKAPDGQTELFINAALEITDDEIRAVYTDDFGNVNEALRLKR